MKKLFLFLFCSLFLLSLISCGPFKNNKNGSNDDNESETGGGSSTDEIKVNLPEEFEIKYNLNVTLRGETETVVMHYVSSREGLVLSVAGAQLMYLYAGDNALMCNYNEEAEAYVSAEVSSTKAEAKEVFDSALPFDTMFAGFDLKKNGTKTFLGRTCDYYVNVENGITSSGCEAYVDQETNVCLKYTVTASNYAGSGSTEYVATVFKTSNVTLPAHPAIGKSITNAFISSSFDGSEPEENVYTNTYYRIGVVYDTPNAVGAYTVSCDNSNVEISKLTSAIFVQFKAAGTYQIKLSGCGSDYILNVEVVDVE